MFNGTYRSQDETLCGLKDRFVVQQFDQGEPGSSRGEIIEDRSSIELFGDTPLRLHPSRLVEGGNIR